MSGETVAGRKIDFAKLDVARDVGQVLGLPGGQVVQNEDLVAATGQGLDDMGADKTGAAGDDMSRQPAS
jgi:hypothetical protein